MLKTVDTYGLHVLLGAVGTIREVLGDDYGRVGIIRLNNDAKKKNSKT